MRRFKLVKTHVKRVANSFDVRFNALKTQKKYFRTNVFKRRKTTGI